MDEAGAHRDAALTPASREQGEDEGVKARVSQLHRKIQFPIASSHIPRVAGLFALPPFIL
jgi:hypothetical protein